MSASAVLSVLDHIGEKVKIDEIPSEPFAFVKKLNALLLENNIDAYALIGGSFAKNTYLKHDHDIDVFVKFRVIEGASDLLYDVLSGFKAKRIRASRDYFMVKEGQFVYEIVPVLAIEHPDESENTPDVSPFHVEFVRSFTQAKPFLCDEIRLAKLFFKAAKVYGAESYIHGFSGHVVDLLVLYYGSFYELLMSIIDWKEKMVIDPLRKISSSDHLNSSKTYAPLIVIDPIQRDRNAAAALSKGQFLRLQAYVKSFLDAPSEDFFVFKALTREDILESHNDFVLIYTLEALEGNKDVVGTKLLKAHEFVVKSAKSFGFSITNTGFEFDGEHALCFICTKEDILSQMYVRVGPPVHIDHAAKAFKAKYADWYEENGVLYVKLARDVRMLKELFAFVKGEEYFVSRINSSKLL